MVDFDQPSLADDCNAVAGLLYLRQNVRGEEDGASLGVNLGYHFIEFLLIEWVKSAAWFVQDEQARLVHEGLYQPQLLFVAVRVFAEPFAGIEAQALDQAAYVGLIDAAAQVAKVLDDLRTAQAGIEGELARQVAHLLLDFGGLDPAIQSTDGGAATVRAQQAHQRAHGGGFARAVRD